MMERPGADSEEKREPVSDIDIAAVDSLKVLDPNRPIREADIKACPPRVCFPVWQTSQNLSTRRRLFHHDIVLLDHLAPDARLVLDEGRGLRRRAGAGLDAKRTIFLDHFGHLQNVDEILGDGVAQA